MKLLLYFQLSVNHVVSGFNANHSYINNVTSGRHLGSFSFQIIFKFELISENGEKTAFSD